jgi:hypothetical protein
MSSFHIQNLCKTSAYDDKLIRKPTNQWHFFEGVIPANSFGFRVHLQLQWRVMSGFWQAHNDCVGIYRGLGICIGILRFAFQSGRLETNISHNSLKCVRRLLIYDSSIDVLFVFTLFIFHPGDQIDPNRGPRAVVLLLSGVAPTFLIHPSICLVLALKILVTYPNTI